MPSPTRTRSRPRRTAAGHAAPAVLTVALALGAGGCVPASDATPANPAARNSAQQLAELTVAAPGSMRGYSRDRFPHWRVTGDECNVRDTVLRRDGEDVELRRCNVVNGRWLSPYDNRAYGHPASVDVDHLVPLANAWRSGAAGWADERRGDFANDLVRPQLRTVSRAANRAKGDQDPSQWKPPNRQYWCRYAQDWIAVKHHWQLSVTAAEKTALTKMLETCPWPSTGPPSKGPPSTAPAAPTSSPARAAR